MITTKLARAVLTMALVATLSTAAYAQDDAPGPEGLDWHLTSYADGERMVALPWHLDATLRLEDGTALGSGGCSDFGAEYALDGRQLSLTLRGQTAAGCSEDATAVEDGYRAALPRVVSWAVERGAAPGEQMLHLYDEAGEMVLTFELPVVSLTPHDVSLLAEQIERLQARVERHEERLDSMRIKVLRERIEALETQAARSAGPDLSAFTAAERLLRQAMRDDIARTCEPRRSQNPAGTVAALQCRPETNRVRDMAVYLMEADDAAKVFSRRMKDAGVKGGTERRSCAFGKPSQMAWTGAGVVAAGCYRNEDGRANLRFTNTATKCKQLTAGNTQLESPHVYIAVLGPDRNIANLWEWAASSNDWEAGEDLFEPIRQPGQPWSNMCPR